MASTCALTLCFVLSMNALHNATSLRLDWESYIHPDMIKQYKGKSTDYQYASNKFEGDINGIDSHVPTNEMNIAEKNVINDEKYRWADRVVPYNISTMFTMEMISNMTYGCIKFIQRTTEDNYIQYERGIQCWSAVGRQGGKQFIQLALGCLEADSIGTIQHEILHALGFYHEQSRLDRYQYVDINWENIEEGNKVQFATHTNADTFRLPYDYESVMHYPWTAFAKNRSLPTIIPKQKYARTGQNKNLSPLDVLKLLLAYKCILTDPVVTATKESLEDTTGRRNSKTMETTATTTANLANFPYECNKKRFRSIFKSAGYNYSFAVKECSDFGGRIMRIDNKSMENCVVEKDSNFKSEEWNYWNGLRRIGNGKYDFIWSDGKMLEQTDYPVWNHGDPWNNKWGDRNGIQTGVIWSYSSSASTWKLSDCCMIEAYRLEGCFCEWNPAEREIGSFINLGGGSDIYSKFPFQCSGRAFHYKTQPLTYSAATMECTKSGGKLMRLANKELSECVESIIRYDKMEASDYWIGLLRLDHDTPEFIWTDGILLKSSDYTNWDEGNAPDAPAERLRTAIFLSSSKGLRWDEESSTNQKGYICQFA